MTKERRKEIHSLLNGRVEELVSTYLTDYYNVRCWDKRLLCMSLVAVIEEYLNPMTVFNKELFDVDKEFNWDELFNEDVELCKSRGEQPLAILDTINDEIREITFGVCTDWSSNNKLYYYILQEINKIGK